jgi:CIC family chloride channel protein
VSVAPGKIGHVKRWAVAFLHRHWRRLLALRERFRPSEEAFNLLLAAVVGALGGAITVAYYETQELSKVIMLPKSGDMVEIAEQLGPWARVLIPTLGGIAAGLVLHMGLRLARHDGSSNLLEVVVAGNGRLPMRSALVNTLSSLISITTGASIGREGLVTHLSAAVASKWGQLQRWQPYRLRLLVACGAGAGISAAYNAPLAGSVFAAQIVLGNFSMALFAPIVLSSVVATIVCRSYFGLIKWYEVPTFDFTQLSQLPWYLLLGIGCGIFGAVFLQALRAGTWLFGRFKMILPVRLGLAGLVVGLIALAGVPQVWGNGYGAVTELLRGVHPLQFVILLALAKLVATSATFGAGTVGGVMTPTILLGAAFGSALGGGVHAAGWSIDMPTGAFALVGMGAMLAATTHSMLLAMLMVFELSLNYSLMPPLMLACAVAAILSRQIHADSIYTAAVHEKSLLLERESDAIGAATKTTVADLMLEPVQPVAETARFSELADRFIASANNFLPVVAENRRLVGVVALQDLKEYLQMGAELNAVIAADVMRPVSLFLTPHQTVMSALPQLLGTELRNIPVVNNASERRLVGRLVRADALGLLSEAIESRVLPR